jgi:aspartyl-tRNA(Asn)/glutamyl-tRNA(Gln) amidotransferase subunit C
MALDHNEVASIAHMARLRLNAKELETYTGQLNSILGFVGQLQELSTANVEPLSHGVELRNVFRDDVRGISLDQKEALANAPARNLENFLVPSVLEESQSAPKKAEDTFGRWAFIAPMASLTINDEAPLNGHFRVGDVIFCSRKYLETNLQQLYPIVKLSDFVKLHIFRDFLSFVVTERTGIPSRIQSDIFSDVREASNILSATASFYSSRSHSCGFTLHGYPMHTSKYNTFLQIDGTAFYGTIGHKGMLFPFTLDPVWHNTIVTSGLDHLFEAIDNPNLDTNWRRQIRSGASMLGRSLMSLELADAFLLNVFGLETLLTNQNERNGNSLTNRIVGLTGWHLQQFRPNYEIEIRQIHNIRCEIVHDSNYRNLTTEFLLLSDMYLKNILLNIVINQNHFKTKQAMIDIIEGFNKTQTWPIDGSVQLRWIGNTSFNPRDLALSLW